MSYAVANSVNQTSWAVVICCRREWGQISVVSDVETHAVRSTEAGRVPRLGREGNVNVRRTNNITSGLSQSAEGSMKKVGKEQC